MDGRDRFAGANGEGDRSRDTRADSTMPTVLAQKYPAVLIALSVAVGPVIVQCHNRPDIDNLRRTFCLINYVLLKTISQMLKQAAFGVSLSKLRSSLSDKCSISQCL